MYLSERAQYVCVTPPCEDVVSERHDVPVEHEVHHAGRVLLVPQIPQVL